MLYFKNTYSTVCGALARQKQAVLSPSVAAHPFYCAVLLIVKSHKYRASCRACHALAYPFADLLLYILYVLSGAQAHRDHAEDVWRASAPEDALLSTYPEGGVGLGMGGRGSVRPTFSTSSS